MIVCILYIFDDNITVINSGMLIDKIDKDSDYNKGDEIAGHKNKHSQCNRVKNWCFKQGK